jgi:hypothetical protein
MTDDIYIDPTRESFDAFKALPRDTPINMLNLLRFRDKAVILKVIPMPDGALPEQRPMPNMAKPAAPFLNGWADQ